ncbi:MAG: beta-galactosidase [Cyanobacteria bacterium J06635_10]
MRRFWRINLTKLLFFILLAVITTYVIVFANNTSASANPNLQQKSEDDWWLPSWVKPLPDVIGFYGQNPYSVPDQTLKLVTFRWSDVNPQEDVYDWSILENALQGNNNVYMRLENSDVDHCPTWLSEKYPDLQPLRLSSYKDNFDRYSNGYFYPMWHPGFKQEFNKLLQSFKDKRFSYNPRLKFAYIPGAWKWGEFDLKFVGYMKSQGMTPNDYYQWFKELIDTYIDAFGEENAHKLMYTEQDVIPIAEGDLEWRNFIGVKFTKYAFDKGLSTRFGLLEKYNFVATDMPNYGISIVNSDDRNYMEVNESSPLISDPNRFIGSESEEIYNENIPVGNYLQLKMTALKNLQVRANVVFMGSDVWNRAPELHNYMMKSLGRHYYDSPDAWCALREAKDVYRLFSQGISSNLWVRNFERWLFQREVNPDGKTVKTYYVNTSVKHNDESYEALRTDTASGNNYIYFEVDDRFIKGGSNKVQVKVTYLDNNSSQWWLEYDAADGNSYKQSNKIQNSEDNRWKTVTFYTNDAAFLNRQNKGMDFRIFNGGVDDITVRFVRVIKENPPS